VTVKGFKKCCISNAKEGRMRRKLRMLAVKVVKLRMATVRVVKLGTVKAVRPIDETG
jgi:hypothetical protein